MYISNITTVSRPSAPAGCSQNIPADACGFLDLVAEMKQTAYASPALMREQTEVSEEQSQQDDRDWEQEWEAEQRRIERQRRMSDRAEEQRKQAALRRAAKRKRLLEYMLFLKETSLERSREEQQRIAGRDEKDIDKTRQRKKTVYVPVSSANGMNGTVYSSLFDGFIK